MHKCTFRRNYIKMLGRCPLFTKIVNFLSIHNQSSKSFARIVWMGQFQCEISNYTFEYQIKHFSIVIGQFKQCKLTISNPVYNHFTFRLKIESPAKMGVIPGMAHWQISENLCQIQDHFRYCRYCILPTDRSAWGGTVHFVGGALRREAKCAKSIQSPSKWRKIRHRKIGKIVSRRTAQFFPHV